MRSESNHLDLNNLPVDEILTATAASTDTIRLRKKKGGKDDGKVYECRFCTLKFCKSQALGGHMNRHRQERETETLNRARQLVLGNGGLPGPGGHIGYGDFSMGPSQCPQFRPPYPRLPAETTTSRIYPSSSSHPLPTFRSSYTAPQPPVGEYFVGHVLSSSTQWPMTHQNHRLDPPNYTCFGTPLSQGFPVEAVRAPAAREGGPSHTQAEGDP